MTSNCVYNSYDLQFSSSFLSLYLSKLYSRYQLGAPFEVKELMTLTGIHVQQDPVLSGLVDLKVLHRMCRCVFVSVKLQDYVSSLFYKHNTIFFFFFFCGGARSISFICFIFFFEYSFIYFFFSELYLLIFFIWFYLVLILIW